jgi:hypothetical protein
VRRFRYRLRRTGGDRRRLEWFGGRIYSQSDEDGIIAEIFRRIGSTNKVFVEFGAEQGTQNNTRLLLDRGWTGLWIEGDPDHATFLRHRFRKELATGRLKFAEAYVDRANINDLIRNAGVAGEIDLLSIDIDGNDYHVFDAIDVIRPRVVCLEHNPAYAPPADWVMRYNPDYRWDFASGATDYGASLVAMMRLARGKGYELVGCGLYSANGFYVRSDLVMGRFSGPAPPELYFNPMVYDEIVRFPRTWRWVLLLKAWHWVQGRN